MMMPSFDQKKGFKVGKNMWYLDNGPSNHMTGYLEKFNELNESGTGPSEFWRWVYRQDLRERYNYF